MHSDPIADMLTRLRNAARAGHESVEVRINNTCEKILSILKHEGFIDSYIIYKSGAARMAKVELRYYQNRPVFTTIERVSKPGRRIYLKWKDIKPTRNNLGLSILSTPKGVLSDKEAKFQHVGGEYLCRIF
ncbi:MAG: 30S ribosomal protein S8 [Turneriella sp.]|nr:30S ribosomal protein S8 [Leptospiraceae bacterium]MCX7633437.1 30S ribosomal protein S8 [Turneriella sp.]